ncbi:MAG: hypothetical protein A2000_16135 [Ignavibacteria bacterium GWB2_36_8]|nr:MAG: hypothetical protein A2000_16135 [Ignavibacteria bacterium GWB2_36_8]OGU50646.1 MAG: hypothetical protein A2080_15110 [Ignavibacteria bacterium GWC2_36_12]
MKNLLYSLVTVTSFLIIQCSNEIPNSVEQINLELGKVSLRIDKENAPANVVLVEAYLMREEYDTLYGALNILSSTSADILFDEVAAGDWHLKVDAKDDNGVVLYSGETEMTVQAGILTQVNLTLVPTGNGTGNVYILVNWGTTPKWVDYINNPIFTIENSPNNPQAVTEAKIIKDNNLFKMWYNNLYPGGVTDIRYAESVDGIRWVSYDSVALESGELGSWDSYGVQIGTVLKEGNTYLMYYTGLENIYSSWHIGLAISSDGINWSKQPLPVLEANYVEPQIHVDCVIRVSNTFYMYYSILNGYYRSIGLATSLDGINWTRSQSNPILNSSQGWEDYNGIYFPSVIFENNIFKMIYMNGSANAFGMATSSNGINWNKSNSNPFFTKQDTHNNWAYRDIAYPNFIKHNNEYRVYYNGGHSNDYNYSIGFIRKIGN